METFVAAPDEVPEDILFSEVAAVKHGPPNLRIIEVNGTTEDQPDGDNLHIIDMSWKNDDQAWIQVPEDEGNEDQQGKLLIIDVGGTNEDQAGIHVPEVEADKDRLANLPITDASVGSPDEAAVQYPDIHPDPRISVIGSRSGRGPGS